MARNTQIHLCKDKIVKEIAITHRNLNIKRGLCFFNDAQVTNSGLV